MEKENIESIDRKLSVVISLLLKISQMARQPLLKSKLKNYPLLV